MTPWIIDASLAVTWYLDDEEDREYGLSVLAGLSEREVRVPALFVYELSNALIMAHRRKRIASDTLDAIFQKLALWNFAIDPVRSADATRLGTLALAHGLTSYDAAYLDLGLRTGFPIATLDKALLRAMQAVDVERVSAG